MSAAGVLTWVGPAFTQAQNESHGIELRLALHGCKGAGNAAPGSQADAQKGGRSNACTQDCGGYLEACVADEEYACTQTDMVQ